MGRKDIFVRIAKPDSTILSRGKGNEFSFMYQGEVLQYSIKEPVNYQNEALDLCLYWFNRSKNDLPEGIYVVSVYAGDYEIGQSTFELR